jgi:hypothetical protein
MDLFEAMAGMNTRTRIPGRSDLELCGLVQTALNELVAEARGKGKALPAKPVVVANGVDGGLGTRPI